MASSKTKKRVEGILLIGICLLTIYYAGNTYFNYKKESQRVILQTLNNLDKEKQQLEIYVAKAEKLAKNIAQGITDKKISLGQIEKALGDSIMKHPELYELAIAFAPEKYNGKKYYAPFYSRPKDSLRLDTVTFDYTLEYSHEDNRKNDWYLIPMNHGPSWIEPYYCSEAESMLMEYAFPFYLPENNDEPDGTVVVGYSLDWVREFMKGLKFMNTGYAMLLSKKGRFLYHPKDDLVKNGQTIFDVAKQTQNKYKKGSPKYNNCNLLLDISEKIVQGESGCYNYTSILSHEKMKFCFRPLSNTGWSISSLCLIHEFNQFQSKFKQDVYNCAILLTLSLLLILIYFFRSRIWTTSIGAVFIFTCAIITIWIINWKFPETISKKESKITNKESLMVFKEDRKKHNQVSLVGPVLFIPTGTFIQSVEFDNANNFTVTGYIWQKYDLQLHKDIKRGVVFPEAAQVEQKEAYRKVYNNQELIGWYFTALIRERFSYTEYPFDKEKLWLRLWHSDFNKNVILTPDFESYDVINPIFKPGLEEDFILSGWNTKASFYSYHYNSYNTNFGIPDYVGQKDFPELYYNIDINRNFFDPFMSHLIPLVVVFLMLYSILQVGRRNDQNGLFGFNTLSTLSACSALFFVIIFDHISLRSTLSVSGLVYFEWFYLVAYLSIMYVSANAIVIAKNSNHRFFNFNDNYISRTMFGPVITGLMYFITLVYFY
jgi:hypothetical protein